MLRPEPMSELKISFTLGERDLKQLAKSRNVPQAVAVQARRLVAEKQESQDICFVPNGDYASVVRKIRPDAESGGEIVDQAGNVLGRHKGLIHYTVGQRRGLKIAAADPLYVVSIDPGQAQVTVGPRDCLAVETVWLREMNWLGDVPLAAALPRNGLEVHVRIRSAQAPRPGFLFIDAATGGIGVRLPGGELGVARGQACVIYDDGSDRARVLGGGFIATTERKQAAVAA